MAGFLPPLPPANLADTPASAVQTPAFEETPPVFAPSSADPTHQITRSNSSASISRSRKSSLLRPGPMFAPGTNASGQNSLAPKMVLEFADGTAYEGTSFGAPAKSVSGECVFQTGMVGYPESLTDPSYEGQILVITYPLVGNYGVPSRVKPPTDDQLPKGFESSRIHIAALIVASYSGPEDEFSHHLAESSLGQWLRDEGIPAMHGIDTRALTKKIREGGSILAKVLAEQADADVRGRRTSLTDRVTRSWASRYIDTPLDDPNAKNLVALVSRKQPFTYKPATFFPPEEVPHQRLHPSGRPLRVLCVDVGMKYNQIRCFMKRGVEFKVVPWDYDFTNPQEEAYDGLFLSNGPGDPTTISGTVDRLRTLIERKSVPIFGICLGHQLLSLAAGAKTVKLPYGNRGANIPCTSLITGKCYVTSQNHGYATNRDTLPAPWRELFVNANDGTNEGIYSTELPYFSVQFHPEAAPGPQDTEFLFDVFVDNVEACAKARKLVPFVMPGGTAAELKAKNPRLHPKKVLVLGSGGLSIGQAGEFDYSGSQAIKALKEEGIYTILVNPNIATIQTSEGLADKVFFLPVTPEFVLRVIEAEKPDGIYVTFGGQTALNVGIKLKDDFARLGVEVLGTPIDTIITTEDREYFAKAMSEIGEKCAQSSSAVSVEESVQAAEEIGYPVIVRAAFALGGLGSGFAQNRKELVTLCNKAFATSPQVLIEKSMKGWKEIEYEVVRDCNDNCITVCNMENFDPLGIHTGDSIVVAPSQTLSDADYNMLRTTAVNVIRHLGVVGECNIQYALNPESKEYCIIEVNARLSRSSALASKATGYPLAFIAAKLGLNVPLNEIRNSVTKKTSACFEPSLDYCVVKIPRWDLRKFTRVSTSLGSSMKSVGEVMSIGRTFEEAIQKAIRAIDPQFPGFSLNDFSADLDYELSNPTDKRIFAIANALHSGYSVEKVCQLSNINKWFIKKLAGIVALDKQIAQHGASHLTAPAGLLHQAKQLGFADRQIAKSLGSNEIAVRRLRHEYGIFPFVKQIDTVAAEFPAYTNYLYTTYNAVENDVDFNDRGVMVVGSGVYRIGSSVEFDWCAVRCIRTLRERGFKTIMVNYNPETVSTDYDEADRLYFETITLETILDIYELERSAGVIVSVGGQTPNNIALPLMRQNVQIFGTSPAMIDTAENRYKFSRMLDRIGVDQPLWKELTDVKEAHEFCDRVDYPVLVRPSYVLSGAAMNVVYSKDDLSSYLTQAADVSQDHPVVITKFIEEAKEIEMDAIALNGKLIMHYISEHVENAGVHSGDATLVHPPQDLDPETISRIEVATAKIADALNVTGPMNIQFMAKNNEIKVIECNLRAARSYPFVSKVTGIDAIQMATDAMLGLSVTPYPQLKMPVNYVGVKVPQFSFSRLLGADPILGVEMASTGEVACFGKDRYEAYLKALLASGISMPTHNVLLSIGSFKEKLEMLPSIQKMHRLGYSLFATSGTADFIQEHGVPVKYLENLPETDVIDQKSEYSMKEHISKNKIDLYINLPSKNRYRRPASYLSNGYRSRRMAVDFAVPLITNVKCAKLFVEALARKPAFFRVAPVDSKTSRGFADLERSDAPEAAPGLRARSPPLLASPKLAPSAPITLQTSGRDHFLQPPSSQMSLGPAQQSFPFGMPMGYTYPYGAPFNGMQQPFGMSTHMIQPQQPYGFMQPYDMHAASMGRPQPPLAMPNFPLESAFHRRHILSVKQFSRNDLHALFSIAHEMRVMTERNSAIELLRGRVLCTLFYEPSTRTSCSFEAAMLRLGGSVCPVAVDRSSVVKGESLADTIRTVGCYADAVVLRHPDVGSSQTAAKFSPVPILNAGDGHGEHPTQAMLDIYTIREELGTVNGLTVTMIGDLKYGRTVHSLVRLLALYNVSLNFVAPTSLSMPDSVKAYAQSAGIQFYETTNLDEVISKSDVLYVTRVQQERFASVEEYNSVKHSFVINNDVLNKAKDNMIVMHPLPRNAEIDPEIDFDGRAAYFRQMKYGLFLRMALLSQVLGL